MYVTREQLHEIYQLDSGELERRAQEFDSQAHAAQREVIDAYERGDDQGMHEAFDRLQGAAGWRLLHVEEQVRRGEGDTRGSSRPREP